MKIKHKYSKQGNFPMFLFFIGKLLAVSPGLFGQEMPAWSLVEVDPTTGNISFVMDIAPAGIRSISRSGET